MKFPMKTFAKWFALAAVAAGSVLADQQPDLAGSGTATAPYQINSADDWDELSAFVAAGGATAGKFFQQTADIAGVKNMVGANDGSSPVPFRGTYLGGGHTLSLSIVGQDDRRYTAPFSCIGGAAIRDLVVTGVVTGGIHAAGLVGSMLDSNVISNVLVDADITLLGTHGGGVVGHGLNAMARLQGVAFTGSIAGGQHVGALWGWSDNAIVAFQNCIENGDYTGTGVDPVGLGGVNSKSLQNVLRVSDMIGTPNSRWNVGDKAYAVTAADGVALDFGAPDISYDASGIDMHGAAMALGGVFYAAGGMDVPLTATLTAPIPLGTVFNGFFSTVGTLAGNGPDYVLHTGAAAATIHAMIVGSLGLPGSGTEDAPYLISDASDWDELVNFTNYGGVTSGLFFLQTADIAGVTNMLGSITAFRGTYLGGGHTLAVALSGAEDSRFVAPFSCIDGAAIRDLVVTGTVKGGLHAAGLVGSMLDSNVISNVLVDADITLLGTHGGGVVGHGGNATASLQGVAFTGTIAGGEHVGALWGWSDNARVSMTNCFENGTYTGTRVNPLGLGGLATGGLSISKVLHVSRQIGAPNRNWNDIGPTAYAITAGENVAVAFAGSGTRYSASGIGVFDAGMEHGGALYALADTMVPLEITTTLAGRAFFSASAGCLAETDAGHTLAMPAADVEISAEILAPVTYLDANGEEQTCDGYTPVSNNTNFLSSGWYLLLADTAFGERIEVSGDVHLILADGMTLTARKGVNVAAPHSLTIYGQTAGTGTLHATADHGAGIGGDDGQSGGAITVNGGIVTARGGGNAAGIGGGNGGDGGAVTINGGAVNATGGNSAGGYTAHLGDGAETSPYVPFYGLYHNSLSETLYRASDFLLAGATTAPVTSLTWTATNTNGQKQDSIRIWMGNVDDNELTDTLHDVAKLTLVYAGDGIVPVVGRNEFVFNEGTFAWDGRSSVLIVCRKDNDAWASGLTWQCHQADFTAATCRYSDNDIATANLHDKQILSIRPDIIMNALSHGVPAAGAGIGGGGGGNGGSVNVAGGTVTAIAGLGAQAIGYGAGGAAGGGLTFPENYRVFSPETSVSPVAAADRADACRGERVKLEVTPALGGSGTETAPYLIGDLDDWDNLARFTNGGGTTIGFFFLQTADIAGVTNMVGANDGSSPVPFRGTYLGGGHTLSLSISVDQDRAFAAPFSCISDASIRDLIVNGSVTGGMHTAGLVGSMFGSNLISNVLVAADITLLGTHGGGVVGHGLNATARLEGVAFTGTIVGGSIVGALWGWSDSASVYFLNCIENGAYTGTVVNPVCLGDFNDGSVQNVLRVSDRIGTYYGHWNVGDKAYAVTAGDGVALDFGAPDISYGASGIDVHGASMVLGGVLHAPGGKDVPLTATLTAPVPPGKGYYGFQTTAGTLVASEPGYVLHTADAAATISAVIIDSPAFSGSGTEDAPYLISSVADWDELVRLTDGGAVGNGVFFLQTADIAGVTKMADAGVTPFTGRYDGGGHTLTMELSGMDSFAAPFPYVAGAVIENLKTAGTVTGAMHASGLVGRMEGTGNIIRNVQVAATVNVTGTHGGGVVGHGGNATATLEGVAFTGSIVGGANVGALWGWSDNARVSMANCLENGTYTGTGVNPVGIGGLAGLSISNVLHVGNQIGAPGGNWGDAGSKACAITAGANVAVALAANVTWYSASGIGVFDAGMEHDGALYAVENAAVPLEITTPLTGRVYISASDGRLVTTGAGHTLVMPAADVEIGAEILVPVTYLDANGKERICDDYTPISYNTNCLAAGWHLLRADAAFGERIEVSGDVHLILADGMTLTARMGVNVAAPHSLTIYGQTAGTGTLNATAVYGAGIGGDDGQSGGAITVNGGVVTALGGGNAAGIGGGHGGDGGAVTVNGGVVNATGGRASSPACTTAIGEGSSSTTYFPYHTLWDYDLAECLFRASELSQAGMTTGPVTSLTWKVASTTCTVPQDNIRIWMGNVDDNELTEASHVVAGLTLVYVGSGILPAVGLNEYVFNQGTFAWDGHSSVLIVCQRNHGSWRGSVSWQAHDAGFKAMAYVYTDNSAYDAATTSYSMSTSSSRPNVIMNGVVIGGGLAGAGIGGGGGGNGGVVTINDGAVTAVANVGAQAIGHGDGAVGEGGLGFPETYRVFSPETSATPVAAADREEACRGERVRLEVCDHDDDGGVCAWCGGFPWLDPADPGNRGKACYDYTFYDGQTELTNGWYVVEGDMTNAARIVVSGDVHLILCDGASLTAGQGIAVAADSNVTNSLTVWAQSKDGAMGRLTANGGQFQAGIGGGDGQDGGAITINGGIVTVVGGEGAAGIGGGASGNGGAVVIGGGTVTAAAGENAEAIGHGVGGTESGDLAFPGNYRAGGGNADPVAAKDRMDACRGAWAKLEVCNPHNYGDDGVCDRCGHSLPAEIANVVAKVNSPFDGTVGISFTVVNSPAAGLPAGSRAVLSVVATDNLTGLNYSADPSALFGDTGAAHGGHTVTWNFAAQGIEFSSSSVTFTVAYLGMAGDVLESTICSGVGAPVAIIPPTPIPPTPITTYAIAFIANGGAGSMAPQVIACDVVAALSANQFTKAGCVFLGWATAPSGAVAYADGARVQNLAPAGGSATFYAQWAVLKYSAKFNGNGGKLPKKKKMKALAMTYGASKKLSKNLFTRKGYVFIGWSTKKKGPVEFPNKASVKNLTTKGGTVTLYAQWAKEKYNVAFYANGGKGKMAVQKMVYGKAKKLSANKFKAPKGKKFAGWATSKANAKKGVVKYKDKKSVKNLTTTGKTVKLYAVWKKK